MSSIINVDIIPVVRARLIEPTAVFWTDDELVQIAASGIKDLWRDIVDLKQEHYCIIDNSHVSLEANSRQLSGVPSNVHKIYMIEARDLSQNGSNHGLVFTPLQYNDTLFQLARSQNAIEAQSDTIFYALRGQGAPVGAPIIDVAPRVTTAVPLSFTYIPTLDAMNGDSVVPIPGEADNAIIAWTVAYARAKEREDRSPDGNWLSIYATEKAHLLQSLGLRQYQEAEFVPAVWQEYW